MSRPRILTVVLAISAVVCAAVVPARAQSPKVFKCKNDNTEWRLTVLSPTPGATISFVSKNPTLIVKARVDWIAKYACSNPKGPEAVKVQIHSPSGALAGSGQDYYHTKNSGDVAEIKILNLKAGQWQLKSYMKGSDVGENVVKGPEFNFTIKTP